MKAQINPELDSLLRLYIASYDSAGLVYFHPNTLVPGQPYAMYQAYQGDTLHKLVLKKQWVDPNLEMTHYRYQETFRNLRVESAEYSEHAQNGYLVFANGRGTFFDADRGYQPQVAEEEALGFVLETMGEFELAWENDAWESDLKEDLEDPNATYYPTGELMWALVDYKDLTWQIPSSKYRLAWRFEILSLSPSFHKAYYVDAYTGVVFREEQLRCNDGPANLLTQGTQTIDTRADGNDFILHTDGNNRDIHTKYHSTWPWGWTSEIEDDDDNWGNNEQLGTTAHWMTSQSWDFFASAPYSRNGIDGTGGELRVNADWDEQNAAFDRRWGNDYLFFGTLGGDYLAVIDVAGHEYTHGVDSYTAELVYQDESGALDESFADIFGFMVERFTEGAVNDWLLGEETPVNLILPRSLEDPNAEGNHFPDPLDCGAIAGGQPDTYEGTFWHDGDCDFGGVHVNSGVQNFWFHLLADGGTGTNDNGDAYNIQGIGIDDAALIAFWNHTNILQSGSQYADARAGAIAAATQLFGPCSNQEIQTTNAWAAVGVGGQSACALTNLIAAQPRPSIRLYPNPASESATLSFPDARTRSIELFHLDGKRIRSFGAHQGQELEVNTAGLVPGVYLLRVQEAGEVHAVKLIKL
jgi:Zn-dependent metalloprotease